MQSFLLSSAFGAVPAFLMYKYSSCLKCTAVGFVGGYFAFGALHSILVNYFMSPLTYAPPTDDVLF